ncbi:hypothetical protein EON64_18205, partial [archaeon]
MEFKLREVWASVRMLFFTSLPNHQAVLPPNVTSSQLLSGGNTDLLQEIFHDSVALLIVQRSSWREELGRVLVGMAYTHLDFTISDNEGHVLAVLLHSTQDKATLLVPSIVQSPDLEALASVCQTSIA